MLPWHNREEKEVSQLFAAPLPARYSSDEPPGLSSAGLV